MENETNYSGIRVSETTKSRMAINKGKLSFNDYLIKILDYLDASSVDINKTPSVAPNVYIKDQISRVIEVTRGVEKKQNQYLKSMLDLLLKMNNGTQNNSPKSEQLPADELTDEQLAERGFVDVTTFQDFIQNNEKLQEQYRQQGEELAKLKKQIQEQPAQGISPRAINKDRMLDALNLIDAKKNTNRLSPSRYEIQKDDLDMYLNVLREEIEKM